MSHRNRTSGAQRRRNWFRKRERELQEVNEKILEVHINFGMSICMDLHPDKTYIREFDEMNAEWRHYCDYKNRLLETVQLNPKMFYEQYKPVEINTQLNRGSVIGKLCSICNPDWILALMNDLVRVDMPNG